MKAPEKFNAFGDQRSEKVFFLFIMDYLSMQQQELNPLIR